MAPGTGGGVVASRSSTDGSPARAGQDRRNTEAPGRAGDFGLVRPRAGSKHYDADALVIAKVAGELAAYGIEPRHLRSFKTAADREIGLMEQVVSPIRRSREDGAEGRAAQTMDEMAVLSVRLHAVLVKGLRSLEGSGR